MSDAVTVETTVADDSGAQHRYVIHMFDTTTGSKFFPAITDAFGGNVFDKVLQLALSGWEEDDGLRSHSDDIRDLAGECARRLIDRGDMEVVRGLLSGCERDGSKVTEFTTYDKVFRANYGEMQRALKAVLEANFSGFLSDRFEPLRTTAARMGKLVQGQLAQLSTGLSSVLTDAGPSGKRGSSPEG